MTLFGLGKPLEEQSATRQNVTQGILVGGGFAGAGAVVLGAIELVKSQPEKGFMLLERWGPWFFLAMFSVWAVNGLLNRFLDVLSDLGDRFVGSMDKIANEQEKLASSGRDQAEAMQRTADRDDRDHERMTTLVDYAGQQSRQALEAVTSMHSTLAQVAAQVRGLAEKER